MLHADFFVMELYVSDQYSSLFQFRLRDHIIVLSWYTFLILKVNPCIPSVFPPNKSIPLSLRASPTSNNTQI